MTENTTAPEDSTFTDDDQHETVRDRYADVASDDTECCESDATTDCCTDTGSPTSSNTDTGALTGCCTNDETSTSWAEQVGYSSEEIESDPSDANLGLGCGNPTAIANLSPGKKVLDLGSGGGFDCFLAADEVGADGSVIGIDMTPEMIEKARENSKENDIENVEFRLGEIEHLPVSDEAIDVIISNCVINLSPDKQQVFEEAYRVLQPGGKLAISDVVLTADLPDELRADLDSIAECIGGASRIDKLENLLAESGFQEPHIEPVDETQEFFREWGDDRDLDDYLISASIRGYKPTN
ncbi:arsenite methyltransferase [Halococcus sp. IIIV-5B]|uniref:arsenite methyltransferase n=1 Tax=Halococcus sp. IIIV-5B TaxID=2321230 RepID=UPI000E72792D|nr:arsenite methyltransferase [Halococcus sp. IIIV-5B]RJT04754.1 methyltransferase domain-containing protein [Halococcus sp. IIIV-5B]